MPTRGGLPAAQAEHLDRFVARSIDGEPAGAETVFERDRCGRGHGGECRIHVAARCGSCAVDVPRLSGRFLMITKMRLQITHPDPNLVLQKCERSLKTES